MLKRSKRADLCRLLHAHALHREDRSKDGEADHIRRTAGLDHEEAGSDEQDAFIETAVIGEEAAERGADGDHAEETGLPTGPGLLVTRRTDPDKQSSPSAPVFWLSAADDGHPHTENLEQFSTK